MAAEGAATIGEALPIAPVAEAWEVRRLDISKKHEQTLAILAQVGPKAPTYSRRLDVNDVTTKF